MLARCTAEQPGKGILFVYPVKGARGAGISRRGLTAIAPGSAGITLPA